MGAATRLAAIILLLAVGQTAAVFEDADIAPLPSRHLLEAVSSTAAGYGGHYSYGYGGYGGYGYGGHHRFLMEYGGYGQYGGYYGSYYGISGRMLEEQLRLEPEDPLLVYAEQQVQQGAGGLSAAALAALKQAHRNNQSLSLPAGRCYCRYDSDFHTWALAEDDCKLALYTRCQTEPGLPCEWLDQFYGPTHGPAHSLPHEADITGFVFEDCAPQPPCACSGLQFDGSDAVPAAVACCKDLRVACKTPFSGLCCKKVEDFCYNDKPSAAVAAWTSYRLHHSDCSEYSGVPYQYTPLEDMQDQHHHQQHQQQQQQQQPTEAELLKTALLQLEQQAAAEAAARPGDSTMAASLGRVLTPQVFIAAAFGFMCVAIVSILAALGRRHETHLASDSDDSDDEQEQRQVTTGGAAAANLSNCLPDNSCCSPTGPSHLASVLPLGKRSSLPGLREPLLPQHGTTTRASEPGMYRVSSTARLQNVASLTSLDQSSSKA